MNNDIILLIAATVIILLIIYMVPVGSWFQATTSGIRITIIELLFMKWRKVPPKLIVNNLIKSAKAGVIVDRDDLQAHHLAGGNVDNVVDGLNYAKARGVELSYKKATQLDLGKIQIVEALQSRVK